jgi:hypothetical protein
MKKVIFTSILASFVTLSLYSNAGWSVTVGDTVNGTTTISCDPGPCEVTQGLLGGTTICDQAGVCVMIAGRRVSDTSKN